MRELGKVINCIDNIAKVKVIKHSACSKCDRDCPLSGADSHEREEMVFKVKNSIGAKQGDQVSIELENRNLVFSSLIIYLMPILNMIIGYFLGQWLGLKYNLLTREISGIFGTVLFLFLSFLLLRQINSNLENNNKIDPKIVKIHNNNKYNNQIL
ncbi:MAG: SoxR reducing system RseC family protein [Bacillota bacterium]